MTNVILSPREKTKKVLTAEFTKGWFEYEASYDGVLLNIDTAGARLLGFSSPDDMLGKKINELYAHPYDHEKTLSMLFRDGKVNGFFTLMKGMDDNLVFIKQSSTLITDEYYHLPLKVQTSFEISHTL
ncbi:hypothetical protein KsCSTR_37700 [Candidatus Kuenenia stuttgartiensis]|jgi:hypothetical protein|uniref:PAS domain-containing protein n=1 Tax=Kuenenia stuttgartiensis TaxID=174633 RepID=Q1Q657_KUEST|nr:MULTISPECIES: hypothetical protein [Kuenenia]MBE7548307.1 hypothetical protein [Planctomycetia bacterium]MBW7941083.1 hypothetical protein [Candidatus Kuenenia stuttgartiensis]MBZ0193106.1 PAS domain-containing protein [Candidatus Kuenenia stuttgartiensis]MCF6150858.1 hypothetical protein [Candidatus Kuenenia stuttgartiensis]MCL4726441.1 PAS domain-containing protein [Candidatus Kuenenia stuttgartiensis]